MFVTWGQTPSQQFQEEYMKEHFWMIRHYCFSPNFVFIAEIYLFIYLFRKTYDRYSLITQAEAFEGDILGERLVCGLRNEVRGIIAFS